MPKPAKKETPVTGSRSRGPDDEPDSVGARRSAERRAYIKRMVAEAPPLTDEQRAKLAELLRPVRRGGAA